VKSPPPVEFMNDQHNLILVLRRDNDEHKFKKELMDKKLEWLFDSCSEDLQERHNQEDLLQSVMIPKWPNSSRHVFPSGSNNK
jgi:hypothetical protein